LAKHLAADEGLRSLKLIGRTGQRLAPGTLSTTLYKRLSPLLAQSGSEALEGWCIYGSVL
jgi:hypothetical protein